MNIRQAQEADIPALERMYGTLYDMLTEAGMPYELDSDALSEILSAQIRSRMLRLLVAEHEGACVGFLSAGISRIDRKFKGGLIGVIHDIFVEPSARKLGAASALLEKAECWMREAGAKAVKCDIVVGNEGGHRFWASHGYGDVSVSAQKEL